MGVVAVVLNCGMAAATAATPPCLAFLAEHMDPPRLQRAGDGEGGRPR